MAKHNVMEFIMTAVTKWNDSRNILPVCYWVRGYFRKPQLAVNVVLPVFLLGVTLTHTD